MESELLSHYSDKTFSVRCVCTNTFITTHDERRIQSLTANEIGKEIASKKAAYEYIDGPRRIYFDIENLKVSNLDDVDKFIVKLIEDFSDFYKLYELSYVVTMNRKSRHPGVSLHIILNMYVEDWKILRNMIRLFVNNKPEYKGIVDVLVYNKTQYMRLPYSFNALFGVSYKKKRRIFARREATNPEPIRFRHNDTDVNVRLVNLTSNDDEPEVRIVHVGEVSIQRPIARARLQVVSRSNTSHRINFRIERDEPEEQRLISVDEFEQAIAHQDDAQNKSVSQDSERVLLPEPEVNSSLNEMIRRMISEIKINDPDDFHFIYSSTYPPSPNVCPFIISDVRECQLYSNRLPNITLPIDKVIKEQKFGVKFEENECSYGSYGSYENFI